MEKVVVGEESVLQGRGVLREESFHQEESILDRPMANLRFAAYFSSEFISFQPNVAVEYTGIHLLPTIGTATQISSM
jgi:hypothetical protein